MHPDFTFVEVMNGWFNFENQNFSRFILTEDSSLLAVYCNKEELYKTFLRGGKE